MMDPSTAILSWGCSSMARSAAPVVCVTGVSVENLSWPSQPITNMCNEMVHLPGATRVESYM